MSNVTYPVQVGISRVWHVIIDNNIDTFNINSSTNQISGDKNPVLTLLESFVALQPAQACSSINV